MISTGLLKELENSGVTVEKETNVKEILKTEGKFNIHTKENRILEGFDVVLYAVGRYCLDSLI